MGTSPRCDAVAAGRGCNMRKSRLTVTIRMAMGPPFPAAAWVRVAEAFLAALVAVAFMPCACASGLADNVVLVANSRDSDSVAIARHYAEVRGVPDANIIELKMPLSETISWKEFVGSVWQPLQDELVRRGWIDALAMDLFDGVGRRKYSIAGHKISALITCRGVPLRIENDPSLYSDFKPYTDRAEFRTNEGAVDSELSLLVQTDYPINAGVPNPLFANDHPTAFAIAQVVKVSRLDGPTATRPTTWLTWRSKPSTTGYWGVPTLISPVPTRTVTGGLPPRAALSLSLGSTSRRPAAREQCPRRRASMRRRYTLDTPRTLTGPFFFQASGSPRGPLPRHPQLFGPYAQVRDRRLVRATCRKRCDGHGRKRLRALSRICTPP